MNTNRELHHFLLLSHEQQVAAIRRLAAMGMSDHTIAAATRLSVEAVRRLLGEQPEKCPRTGVPLAFCTCSLHGDAA